MSKISQLMGKSKTFTIGGIELEIKPRTLKDLDVIVDLSDEKKKGLALAELIRRTLKDAIPDATDDELASIGIEHFKTLSEAIVEVNGLSKENASTD